MNDLPSDKNFVHLFSMGERELQTDMRYAKIPPQKRQEIIDAAIQTGWQAAKEITAICLYQGEIAQFFALHQIQITEKDIDCIVGNRRYYSDFLTQKKQVTLYKKSIQIYADKKNFSYEEAQNYILAHEFFHFLECTTLGLTSKKIQIPILSIGKWKIGKQGIRAMSEIAANTFAFILIQNRREKNTLNQSAVKPIVQQHSSV